MEERKLIDGESDPYQSKRKKRNVLLCSFLTLKLCRMLRTKKKAKKPTTSVSFASLIDSELK